MAWATSAMASHGLGASASSPASIRSMSRCGRQCAWWPSVRSATVMTCGPFRGANTHCTTSTEWTARDQSPSDNRISHVEGLSAGTLGPGCGDIGLCRPRPVPGQALPGVRDRGHAPPGFARRIGARHDHPGRDREARPGAGGARRPAARPALAAGPPALFGARPGFARRHLVVRSTGRRTVATILAMPPVGRPRRRPGRLPGRGQRRARSDPGRTGRWPGPRVRMPPVRHAEPRRRHLLPRLGIAALPVPDLIEEMVSRVLEDGGDVLVAGGGWSPPPAHASVRKWLSTG